MDPIVDAVAAAIAVGAATGLMERSSQAVQDSYRALRKVLSSRYVDVDLRPVEQRPASLSKRQSLAEDLAEAGATNDTELAALAEALVKAIRGDASSAAAHAEVDLENVAARFLEVRGVTGPIARVHVNGAQVSEGITITDVHADAGGGPDPKG